PESMLVLEGLGFGIDILMSGVLFGVVPALWLIPALHGKIEPLMGMRPRVPGGPFPGRAPKSGLFIGAVVLLSIASFFFAFLEAFQPEFLEEYGNGFVWISVIAIVIVTALAILFFRKAQHNADQKVDN